MTTKGALLGVERLTSLHDAIAGIIRQESGAMSGTKAEAHDTRETVKGETEPVHEVTLASSVRLQGPSTSICPEKGLGDVSSS